MAEQNTAAEVQLVAAEIIFWWIKRFTMASNYHCAVCTVSCIDNIQPQNWYLISEQEAYSTIRRDRNERDKRI
jgi:hypothetical protein